MNRRQLFAMSGAAAVATAGRRPAPPFANAKDGTRLFAQDWGEGRPVVLMAGWALNSDIWESHIARLNSAGFRCVAPDRRGHGRSEISRGGYDLDTLAGDLAAIVEHLDLRDVTIVAHSMAANEAVRYYTRYGSRRVAKMVLVSPTTPCLAQKSDNPDGIPSGAIEAGQKVIAENYPKWIGNNEAPFFTAETDAETRAWIKQMMMQVPLPVAMACARAMGSSDVREDVKAVRCPTMVIHGDKDASAPITITGEKTARLLERSTFKVYAGAPHGLWLTHRERLITDLLAFLGA